MPLSDYEREVLAQMERALRSDDPDLATSLRGEQNRPSSGIGRWLLGGAAVLAGLIVLVVAVAIAQPWVGVIGFVVMFAGAWWAITKPKASKLSVIGTDGKPRPAKSAKSSKRNSSTFMERMEERWDNREDL